MPRALLVVGVVCCVSVTLRAQAQIEFFASIFDREGAVVTGVQADELTVTEDGAQGSIVGLEPIAWPTKIVILADNGRLMRNSLLQLRNGLKGLIKALPAGVEISLQTTAPQPRSLLRPTSDKGALLTAVDRVTPDESAARFFDALYETAERFDSEREMRNGGVFPVVIILGTSGVDGSQFNEYHVKRLMDRLRRRPITMHVVMLSNGVVAFDQNQTNLGITLSRMTGGRYEGIVSDSRLQTLLPEIGAQVAKNHELQSHQYRVTFRRPAGRTGPIGKIGLTMRAGLDGRLSFDGRLPP